MCHSWFKVEPEIDILSFSVFREMYLIEREMCHRPAFYRRLSVSLILMTHWGLLFKLLTMYCESINTFWIWIWIWICNVVCNLCGCVMGIRGGAVCRLALLYRRSPSICNYSCMFALFKTNRASYDSGLIANSCFIICEAMLNTKTCRYLWPMNTKRKTESHRVTPVCSRKGS